MFKPSMDGTSEKSAAFDDPVIPGLGSAPDEGRIPQMVATPETGSSTGFVWSLRGRCYKLGDDVPHPDGVIPAHFVTAREMDPAVLVPHLFEATDPGFPTRCRPGDLIVTGRNFGTGPKGNGYIAMHALGLGLLCESMSVQAYRAAISTGLRVLSPCPGITTQCDTGEDIAIDFLTGVFTNHTRGTTTSFAPVPEALRELIAQGGNAGWLEQWWRQRSATTHEDQTTKIAR